MAYCTQEDIEKLLPAEELTEITAESGEAPDVEVVAQAIAMAGAEIDAYLGTRHRVPLSPAPDRVKGLAIDMAIYHLYSRRGVAPTVRRQKYEDALTFLKDVAAGRAVITGADGLTADTETAVAEAGSSTRVFSRRSLGEW